MTENRGYMGGEEQSSLGTLLHVCTGIPNAFSVSDYFNFVHVFCLVIF